MEIKIQTKLEGEAAELFVASMERNHRTASGEAAYRIERGLEEEFGTSLPSTYGVKQ